MGIDYRAVLGIGVVVDTKYDVVEFLGDNGLLSDQELEYIEENGVTEYEHDSGIEVIGLNTYTGYGFFIGYEFNPFNPETFVDKVNTAISDWKRYLPDVESRIVHTVKVY